MRGVAIPLQARGTPRQRRRGLRSPRAPRRTRLPLRRGTRLGSTLGAHQMSRWRSENVND